MENSHQPADSRQVNVYEYLLLISPPVYIRDEVMNIKKQFHEKYNHLQATKSKPHITLAQFLLSDIEEKALLSRLESVTKITCPFNVALKKFDHFKTHTIYAHVDEAEPVVNLVKSLHAALGLPPSRSFFVWKPHLTIAKGLTEEKFVAAMQEFQLKDFEVSFIAERIILMKHAGRFVKYDIVREFEFGE